MPKPPWSRGGPHLPSDGHHFSDKVSYRLRFVLSGRSFQCVGAFKPIRTGNLHLPPVVRLRANDQDPPISSAVRKAHVQPGLPPPHALPARSACESSPRPLPYGREGST